MKLHEQTFNRFKNQHKIIKHYIDDLPPEAIYKRLTADKWCVHEILAYLNRYQHLFYIRLRSILDEVNPFFEVYNPDKDTEYQFTVAKTSGYLMHDLYRMRNQVEYILEELDESRFGRVGTHAIMGCMNVCQWVEFFLLHESNQLYKIFKLSGQYWALENTSQDNVILMPGLSAHADGMVG